MKEFDYKNLVIDRENINEEIATQASKFLYIAELCCSMQGKYDIAQKELEDLRVQIDSEVREDARNNEIKLTEKAIEVKIKLDVTYSKKTFDLINLKTKTNLLKSLKEAWSMRGNNLSLIVKTMHDEIYLNNNSKLTGQI